MITINFVQYLFYQCMLFNVNSRTNAILFKIDDLNKKILTKVYVSKEPTYDEKDMYYSILSEVTGDIGYSWNSEVSFYIETFDMYDNKNNGYKVVYAKCDYLDDDGLLKE